MTRIILLMFLTTALASEDGLSLTLSANDKPVMYLCESIAKQCKAGLIVETDVTARMSAKVSIQAKKLSWQDVSKFFAETYDLQIEKSGDFLVVSSMELKRSENLKMNIYNPSLLNCVIDAYPGPLLHISEPGSDGGNLMTEIVMEEMIDVEGLIDLFDVFLDDMEFEAQEVNGLVHVLSDDVIHAQIKRLVDNVEEQVVRQIACRIYDVSDKAEAIHKTVLDARSWKALRARNCIGNFTVLDTSRNHFYAGESLDYLSDVDLVGDDYDPVISRITTGLVVDVSAQMTADGIVMNIRAVDCGDVLVKEDPVLDASKREITKRQDISVKSSSLQDARLVPFNGAAILRLGKKTYALECLGQLPKPMQSIK